MRARQQGFSLVELATVLAVIGIVLAVAIPSYQSYIRSGQEGAARALLIDVAQKQVQYRTDRRGAYCCTGVTEDAAGAEAMLTGLNIRANADVRDYFDLVGFYQAYQESPYLPAAFAFCLAPKTTAATGTRAFRIDQAGHRTLGTDCAAAKAAGATTW